jgi:protoheme IX farnesyltransferase
MLKDYYKLTKPGIIYGNDLSAIAGFFLAANGHVDIKLFIAMILGLSLIIASACVFNNIYDSKIDALMQRTKNRAIPSGAIKKSNAIIFALTLLALGTYCLQLTTYYSLCAALLGFTTYVFLYTPLKHKTTYATLIGAISGATPPVVGYTAIMNKYDLTAVLLFLILVFWQMPHFYGIAIRRMEEYKSAQIPVLPIAKGLRKTKIEIVIYIILFLVSALSLSYFKITGKTFAVIMLALGLYWLKVSLEGFKKEVDEVKWAKKVFLFSLQILLILSIILSLNFLLP